MLEAFSLFFAAFFAATILPFSSEVALITALSLGMNPLLAITSASLGNILAITTNYLFGLLIRKKSYKKLRKTKVGNITLRWFQKYGNWTLPLTVLPVIGDPLTIIAGIFKVNFLLFFSITALLRVARYIFIYYTLS